MPDRSILWSERTWLVVVVYEVVHCLIVTAVRRAMNPIEDNIVDEVKDTIPTNRRVTTRVVCPEVAHEATVLSTERRAKGMVIGIECLGRDGVLDSYVHGSSLLSLIVCTRMPHMAVEGDIFVEPPFGRNMVEHDVSNGITTERVLTMVCVCLTATEAHVTNHNIVSVNAKGLSCNTDAIARRCLPSNSDIRSLNNQWALKTYDSRNVKDNDSRAASLTCLTKGTRSGIGKRCHDIYLSATTTKRVHSTTLSTWESWYLCLWEICWTPCPRHIRSSFCMFFHYYRLTFFPHCRLMLCPRRFH